MREIDFLPTWYPLIQRRYRAVILQASATVAILVLLTGYALVERWKVHIAGRTTAQTEAQIRVSQLQLSQLAEKMKYEDKLRRQDEIVARLGIGVDTTRLLKALEDAMTPAVVLTNLSLETVELAVPTQISLSASHRTANTSDPSPEADRRLKVLVDGVAPTDMEVATLMDHLQKVGCFESVSPQYMRETRSRDGHVLREFEITFEMNLNSPTEGRQ